MNTDPSGVAGWLLIIAMATTCEKASQAANTSTLTTTLTVSNHSDGFGLQFYTPENSTHKSDRKAVNLHDHIIRVSQLLKFRQKKDFRGDNNPECQPV